METLRSMNNKLIFLIREEVGKDDLKANEEIAELLLKKFGRNLGIQTLSIDVTNPENKEAILEFLKEIDSPLGEDNLNKSSFILTNKSNDFWIE